MKVIVLGCNTLGEAVARYLAEGGDEVTLIDASSVTLEKMQNTCDLRTVVGYPSHPHILRKADAGDADMLVALTHADEVNIIACRIAHSLFGVPKKIARIQSRAYLVERKVLFDKGLMPIDAIVSPDQAVAKNIKNIIDNPSVNYISSFASDRLFLSSVICQKKAILSGHPLARLKQLVKGLDVCVVSLRRNDDQQFVPCEETHICAGDEVFFVSTPKAIGPMSEALGHTVSKVKHVAIAGGGRLGFYLADITQNSYKVKIIEINRERCDYITQELNSASVLQGSITDENLLHETGIGESDYFCALSDDEADNILSALLAKQFGAKKVLSLLNRQSYLDMIRHNHINIDVTLHPQQVSMGQLLRHVRPGSLANVHLHTISGGESIEIAIHGTPSTSKVIGRKVNRLHLPEGVVIAGLVRNNEAQTISDDLSIEKNDHVIVYISDRKKSTEVTNLFGVSPFYS